jgi:hypothetical protein
MNPISYSGISPYLRPSLPSLFLTANNSLPKKFGAKSLRLKILLLNYVDPKISGANHAKPIVFKDSRGWGRGEGTRIIRLQAAALASRYASDTTGLVRAYAGTASLVGLTRRPMAASTKPGISW